MPQIRSATFADLHKIKELYYDICAIHPNNLSPFYNEITDDFIYDGLKNHLSVDLPW